MIIVARAIFGANTRLTNRLYMHCKFLLETGPVGIDLSLCPHPPSWLSVSGCYGDSNIIPSGHRHTTRTISSQLVLVWTCHLSPLDYSHRVLVSIDSQDGVCYPMAHNSTCTRTRAIRWFTLSHITRTGTHIRVFVSLIEVLGDKFVCLLVSTDKIVSLVITNTKPYIILPTGPDPTLYTPFYQLDQTLHCIHHSTNWTRPYTVYTILPTGPDPTLYIPFYQLDQTLHCIYHSTNWTRPYTVYTILPTGPDPTLYTPFYQLDQTLLDQTLMYQTLPYQTLPYQTLPYQTLPYQTLLYQT